MILKIPFAILEPQVNQLYLKEFSPEDTQSIEDHCEFIQFFIEASGWTTEEYIETMWKSSSKFTAKPMIVN